MGTELPDYIEGSVREKLDKIKDMVSKNLHEDVVDVFPSNRPGESGPEFIGLWLFTKTLVSEVRNPLRATQIQHDVARIAGLVDWLRLTARHYEFNGAVSQSELDLEFSTVDGLNGTLSATGQSCDLLMELYRRRFQANFSPPASKLGESE